MATWRLSKNVAVWIMLWLIVGVIVSVSMPIAVADVEPNDDFGHAEVIAPGVYEGSLLKPDNRDCYKITGVKPGQMLVVVFTFTCEHQLYDSYGTAIICSEDTTELVDASNHSGDGIAASATVSWTSSSSKSSFVYYILADCSPYAGPGIAHYSLNVSIRERYDAGSGTDAGNTFATAMNLGPGYYEGWMYDMDIKEGDDYKITGLKAGQELRVKGLFTARGQYGSTPELAICTEDGTELVSEMKSTGAAGTGSITLSWTGSSSRESYTYYIVVHSDLTTSLYDFRYSINVSVIDHFDAASGTDAGDTFESAYRIAPGVYNGHLADSNTGADDHGSDDSADFYKVDLSTAGNISLRIEPGSKLGVKVSVYGPNRDELGSSYSPNPGAAVELEVKASAPGTYYIGLEPYSSSTYGDYSFNLSVKVQRPPSKVTASSTGVTQSSVTLTWTQNADPDFYKYEIYQSTSLGALGTLIHTVEGQTSTTYDVTDLSPDTTYYFIIRVVNTADLYADSDQITVKTQATPASKQCVIATATFGSELSPEVSFLRGFRNDFILKTYAGSQFYVAFDAFYYSWSTPVAVFIGAHPAVRTFTKFVLYPLIGALHLTASLVFPWSNAAPEVAVVTAGFIASCLIGLIYFFPLALAIRYALSKIRTVRPVTKRFLRYNALFVLLTIPAIAIGAMVNSSMLTTIATSVGVLATVALATSTGLYTVERKLLFK
jgi:hypothetical protein